MLSDDLTKYKPVTMFGVLLIVILSFSAIPVFAESQQNAVVGVSQSVQASNVVGSPSQKISVVETITDNLDETWTYSYKICFNAETKNIWMIIISTRFPSGTTLGSLTNFNSHPSWFSDYSSIDSVYPCYDARNIDSSITQIEFTQTWPSFPGPPLLEPIVPGELASGFSFRANAYDPNPKVFEYEVEGHWAAFSDGIVSGWGWTSNVCRHGTPPVGGELVVSSEPQSAISKYGLLFSMVLIAPAAAIFYLEKKKRRR